MARPHLLPFHGRTAAACVRALLLCALVLTLTTPRAGSAQSPLDGALRAYDNLQLESAIAQVQQALRAGHLQPRDLVVAHRILGMSLSSLGEQARAREAYLRMLHLDPHQELSTDYSPVLRAPYLEAFAEATLQAALDARADWTTDGNLIVHVDDAVGVIDSVRVHLRVDTRWTVQTLQADTPASLTTQSDAYYLELVDRYGNVWWRRGDREVPLVHWREGQTAERARADETAEIRAPGELLHEPRAGRRAGVALTVIGAAMAGAGGLTHYLRERTVRRWNSPSCEVPDAGSRGQQCDGIRREYQVYQWSAVGAYVLGAASLATGLAMWLRHPQRDRPLGRARLRCSLGAQLRCEGTF